MWVFFFNILFLLGELGGDKDRKRAQSGLLCVFYDPPHSLIYLISKFPPCFERHLFKKNRNYLHGEI